MNKTVLTNENSIGILRSVMMGLFSAVLFMTFFFTIFAPYPVAITSVLHGRLRAAIVLVVSMFAVYFLVAPGTEEFLLISLYIIFGGGTLVMASFGLSEVVRREIGPIKGILLVAGFITSVNTIGLVGYAGMSGRTIESTITQSIEQMQPWFKKNIEDMKQAGQDNVFEFEAIFTQPELLINKLIEHGPGTYVEFLLLMLWVNLFLLLKGNRLIKTKNNCKYNEMDLMNFKMPEPFVWVVIASLLLALLGSYLKVMGLTILGMTALKGLGVFYFFQGFSIYISFLNYMKVTGFIRTFLIVLTVFSAWPILVCIGLADMFIDFNKLMVKKDRGDL